MSDWYSKRQKSKKKWTSKKGGHYLKQGGVANKAKPQKTTDGAKPLTHKGIRIKDQAHIDEADKKLKFARRPKTNNAFRFQKQKNVCRRKEADFDEIFLKSTTGTSENWSYASLQAPTSWTKQIGHHHLFTALNLGFKRVNPLSKDFYRYVHLSLVIIPT